MSGTQTKLNIKSLQHVYLTVRSARQSAEWYRWHFGMEETEPVHGHIAVRLPEGAPLVLVETARLNVYENNPFHFKCSDGRKAQAGLVKQGVWASEPVDWHHYVDFVFKDADGNPVSVISDPAWAPHPNNYFRLDGVFVGAQCFEPTLEWYKDVLGTDIEYDFTVETSALPEARMCCFRGVPFTLFESPGGAVHCRFCDFGTSDAASDHAYLRAKGVSVTELNESGGARTFAFTDPEGREFGMIEEG